MTWGIGWRNPFQNTGATNTAPATNNAAPNAATGQQQPPPPADTFDPLLPNGATVGLEHESQQAVPLPRGGRVTFGTTASVEGEVEQSGGYTTAKMTGTVEVNLGGEVDVGRVGFGANVTTGVRTTYELKMSDADFARYQNGELPTPDPYNPSTMPVGSSVLTQSTEFQGTNFEASYNVLKGETGVEESESLSTLTEKTGENTVRVTIGPSEAIENSFQLGLDFGAASVHVGNTTSLENSSMKTAEFDLSTPEGQAAYNLFLTEGVMPSENGAGISGVATVERLDYESVTSVGGSLGPLTGSIDIASSETSIVKTTYGDGSYDLVTDAKLHAGSPVHLEQHFNADGTEDLSQQKISMHFTGLGGDSEEQWAQAYGVDESDFDGDMDIEITMNADQAMDLRDQAQATIAAWEEQTGQEWDPEFMTQDMKLIDELANAENPQDVAHALIGAYGGPEWMGNAFATMNVYTGQTPPGSIQAVHR